MMNVKPLTEKKKEIREKKNCFILLFIFRERVGQL